MQKENKAEGRTLVEAIQQFTGFMEFDAEGKVLNANPLMLQSLGYELEQVLAKDHGFFVDPSQAADANEFWERLQRGEAVSGEFLRVGSQGRKVWLQASYTPVMGNDAKLHKLILLANDITEGKNRAANSNGIIAAIEKSMALVEFGLDGTIIRANSLFLERMGYTEEELKGKHHRIFVDPSYANSEAYSRFWSELALGRANRGRFERFSKSGDSVWLEATYSPIFDPSGKPVKVIKFAYDISSQVEQSEALEQALAETREADRQRRELDRAVQEMSTPVTPIWEGILLLPLVGVLDSMRTSDIMNKSLAMIAETRAKVFVLDISGVATVDTAVANQLIKITKATRLMGCDAIISGLSPAIARTIVELGVNVDEIRTTATLRDAFESALLMVGETIGSKGADAQAG
ncbi:MAG: PAS domain S-box protein [Gammaproteobacteria bacterium]|nr:PAS domain S-box protein [Gammaproteobacteria bacterium]